MGLPGALEHQEAFRAKRGDSHPWELEPPLENSHKAEREGRNACLCSSFPVSQYLCSLGRFLRSQQSRLGKEREGIKSRNTE